MTNRNAAKHEFNQEYSFTSTETRATADSWYTILEQQQDVKPWLSTCETIAFNLGEQWVSLDSIRGAADARIEAVMDAAFADMAPRLGLQIMLERVLKQLQQGNAGMLLDSHEAGVDVQQVHGPKRALALPDQRETPSKNRKKSLLPISEAGMLQTAITAMAKVCMAGCRPVEARGDSVYFVNEGHRCMHSTFHHGSKCCIKFMDDGSLIYHCCSGSCKTEEDVPVGKWEAETVFDPKVMSTVEQLSREQPDDAEGFERVCLAYMNRFFAVVNAPNAVEVVEELYTRDGRVKEFVRRKPGDAKHRLAYSSAMYRRWFDSQDRREYRDYDFCVDPTKANPVKYNTFCGKFPFEHVEAPFDLDDRELERIRPILRHYNTIFCGDDPELSAYMWNWFALPLQQRGLKTEVAVVIQGPPGTGKGLLVDRLIGSRIYGRDMYKQVHNADDLLGNFNSATADKLLINVDEATFGGSAKQANRLKGIITEPTTQMERKGKDSITIPSYSNLVLTSNEDFPVNIAGEDRRYFVLGTSRDHANDQDYFKPIAALMTDERNDVALLFYRWLMSRDLKDFEVRRFPKSKARLRMQIEARDPFFEWLQEVCIQPQSLLNGERPNVHKEQVVSSADIYTAYLAWYYREVQGTGQQRMTKCMVCKKLTAFLGPHSQARVGSGGQRSFTIPPVAQIKEEMIRRNVWDDSTG